MSDSNIRQALEGHLSTLSVLPDVAWDNVHFEPVVGTSFVESHLQPFRERRASVGKTGTIKKDGLYIINIMTPKNEGSKEADTLSDEIKNHFEASTSLTHGGTTVRILYAERKPPVEFKSWMATPIVMEYYVFE